MIITLEDYKSYTGIVNPKKDEKLQFIVDYVNTYIENYCNTTFSPVTHLDVRVTSDNGEEVLLPNAPIISVEEVRALETVVDPLNYLIDEGMGALIAYSSFPTTRFAISVDYTSGYSEVPRDLVLSAMEFVTHLDKREFTKSRDLGNGESADYGDATLIPAQVRLGLNMHKVL